MKKPRVIILVVLLLFVSACAGGSGSSAKNAYPNSAAAGLGAYDYGAPQAEPEMAYAYDEYYENDVQVEEAKPVLTSGRSETWNEELSKPEKIIKSGSVDLSTDRFDSDKTRLETLALEMGGFIQQSNIYNRGAGRYYEAVFRVPAERFSDMKKAVEETGKLISSSENAENVTGQYYDMKERLEAKRVEEERILELIEQADSVETLLALEEYLGRVRTDIDLFESRMKDIDSLSSFSTINVTLTEGLNVQLLANTGNFGQKLWSNFRSSASGTASFFGNILVFLAGAAVPLALIALVIAVGITAYKRLFLRIGRERLSQ